MKVTHPALGAIGNTLVVQLQAHRVPTGSARVLVKL
jgi:hypothetical protein